MRQVVLKLWQNLGTITPGAMKVISAETVDLAEKSQEMDGANKLTKVVPGSLTTRVLDQDGTIEAFLESQLSSPDAPLWRPNTVYDLGAMVSNGGFVYTCIGSGRTGSAGPSGTSNLIPDGSALWEFNVSSGLLPPWFEFYVDGARVFLGTADPARIVNHRSASDISIEIGAVDWSMQLAGIYLGTPTAPPWQPRTAYTVGQEVYNGGSVYVCIGSGTSGTAGGPSGATPGVDGPPSTATPGTTGVTWSYLPNPWQRPAPQGATNWAPVNVLGQNYPALADGAATGPWILSGTSSQVCFLDPCAWCYAGALLEFASAPILFLRQVDAETLQNIGAGIFPPGMIAQSGLDNTLFQVSADGASWVTPPYDTAAPAGVFKVISQQDLQYMSYTSDDEVVSYLVVQTNPSPWPSITDPATLTLLQNVGASFNATFSLEDPIASDLDYWTVQVAVPESPSTPCYALCLDSVDGIAVGDVVGLVGAGQSWTVASVDPILVQITTVESVSNVVLGAHVYWTTASQNLLVLEDARTILQRAVAPFGLDTSLFVTATTSDPVFSLLPMRPASGANLWPVGDLEPTLTGLKAATGATWTNPVNGEPMPSYSWTGTPDEGWTGPVTATYAPNADWTCQLQSAPSSLMPYEVSNPTAGAAYNPFQQLRNRAYGDGTTYRRENNGIVSMLVGSTYYLVNASFVETLDDGVYEYVQDGVTYTAANASIDPWTPVGANLAGILVVYDYTAMARYEFNGSVEGGMKVSPWTGSGWGTDAYYNWPSSAAGQYSYIQSAVPMIGTQGAILGYAVTAAIYSSINNSPWPSASTSEDRLELYEPGGALIASALISDTALIGGTLVTTPWGVYLVGANAIAQVTLSSAGVLTLTTVYLAGAVDCLFWQSLVALDANELIIMGRLDVAASGASTTTETWMFRLSTPFQSALDASVLWSEKIAEGAPTLIGALRDPSKPGRVVGHYGGSLWQVDATRPWCLERFQALGMTSMELVEHVCQYFNALAIPDANGTLHIVSRVQDDAPQLLRVDQVSRDVARSWPDFASIVRVSSQDSNYYYDAYGQAGGVLLEIGTHPLCWSLSSCAAMAESLKVWFGQPRKITAEEWFFGDPDAAAPWEGLQLWTSLIVNGAAPGRLSSLRQNYIKGQATAKLIGE